MSQKLHIFRAATLDQAYKRMRKELGEDAIVVRTAHVKQDGWRGLLGRKLVEVTAAGKASTPPAPRGAAEAPRLRSASTPLEW